MPSLAAMFVASIAGWLLDDLIASYVGVPIRVLVSIVASVWVFYYARRFFLDLRGR